MLIGLFRNSVKSTPVMMDKTTRALPQSQTIALHGIPRDLVGLGTLRLPVLLLNAQVVHMLLHRQGLVVDAVGHMLLDGRDQSLDVIQFRLACLRFGVP